MSVWVSAYTQTAILCFRSKYEIIQFYPNCYLFFVTANCKMLKTVILNNGWSLGYSFLHLVFCCKKTDSRLGTIGKFHSFLQNKGMTIWNYKIPYFTVKKRKTVWIQALCRGDLVILKEYFQIILGN